MSQKLLHLCIRKNHLYKTRKKTNETSLRVMVMKFINETIRKLLNTRETLGLQKDIDSSENSQIIEQFFVSHHQDSIQITLIRKGNAADAT